MQVVDVRYGACVAIVAHIRAEAVVVSNSRGGSDVELEFLARVVDAGPPPTTSESFALTPWSVARDALAEGVDPIVACACADVGFRVKLMTQAPRLYHLIEDSRLRISAPPDEELAPKQPP